MIDSTLLRFRHITHFPVTRDQMNSGITTVKYSESEPESAKKESILIPIENQCRHFIFSLVLVEVMDSQT